MSTALQGRRVLVVEAATGRAGIAKAAGEAVDLVMLDLGLPDLDGKDVVRALRAWSPVPILILSVRQTEAEKVAALDAGADDFIVDRDRHEVRLGDRPVRLTPKEFELLRVLAQNAGHIVMHDQLLREVWGKAHANDTHYLRVFVGQLRQKLGDDAANPRYVHNEPGVGYRLLI